LLKFSRLVHYGFVIKAANDWRDVRPQVEMQHYVLHFLVFVYNQLYCFVLINNLFNICCYRQVDVSDMDADTMVPCYWAYVFDIL